MFCKYYQQIKIDFLRNINYKVIIIFYFSISNIIFLYQNFNYNIIIILFTAYSISPYIVFCKIIIILYIIIWILSTFYLSMNILIKISHKYLFYIMRKLYNILKLYITLTFLCILKMRSSYTRFNDK